MISLYLFFSYTKNLIGVKSFVENKELKEKRENVLGFGNVCSEVLKKGRNRNWSRKVAFMFFRKVQLSCNSNAELSNQLKGFYFILYPTSNLTSTFTHKLSSSKFNY